MPSAGCVSMPRPSRPNSGQDTGRSIGFSCILFDGIEHILLNRGTSASFHSKRGPERVKTPASHRTGTGLDSLIPSGGGATESGNPPTGRSTGSGASQPSPATDTGTTPSPVSEGDTGTGTSEPRAGRRDRDGVFEPPTPSPPAPSPPSTSAGEEPERAKILPHSGHGPPSRSRVTGRTT